MSGDLRLYGHVLSMTETALVLEYAADNVGDSDVLVCNRLYQGRAPDGSYLLDPNLVYVNVEPGPRPNVGKWVPERTDDVAVEYPTHPIATLLRPGERLTEQVTVALPLSSYDAYHPIRVRPTTPPVASNGLSISLGWFPRERLDDRLVVDVNTSVGRYPLVKASWAAQPIARIDLDVSVPVVPDEPEATLQRQCTRCGATNLGEQPNCLRCGTPLPPPVAPAGAGWQPTHRIPPGGLQTYESPGGPAGAVLDAGLPVQVAESYGDWARVVAWTGWTGWVDGRRLVPGG